MAELEGAVIGPMRKEQVWVFRGTRVPIQTLLDYFAAGQSLDEFLDDFPSVTRDQAVNLLEEIKIELVASSA